MSLHGWGIPTAMLEVLRDFAFVFLEVYPEGRNSGSEVKLLG